MPTPIRGGRSFAAASLGVLLGVASVIAQVTVIATPPADATAATGAGAVFSVAVLGGPLSYQWRKNGFDLPGQVAATPALAPLIVAQPLGTTIAGGTTAGMSAIAVGMAALNHQRYRGVSGDVSNPVAGANGASFTTPALTAWARYWVRVSNAFGSIDSAAALVRVTGGTMTLADWTALPGVPASERGPHAMPAGDGVTNLVKFVLGVPPMDRATASRPVGVTIAETGMPLALGPEFTFNPFAQGVGYALEASVDLATWAVVPSALAVLATNPDGTQRVCLRETAPPAGPTRFVRLAVSVVP